MGQIVNLFIKPDMPRATRILRFLCSIRGYETNYVYEGRGLIMLKTGLYEQIIDQALAQVLDNVRNEYIAKTGKIDKEEASLLLAKYISEIIKMGLDHLKDSDERKSLDRQINLTNRLISSIIQETGEDYFVKMSVDKRAEQLLSVVKNQNKLPQKKDDEIIRPSTSVAYSSLFTGAKNEPNLSSEFNKEIASCDRVDMLVYSAPRK